MADKTDGFKDMTDLGDELGSGIPNADNQPPVQGTGPSSEYMDELRELKRRVEQMETWTKEYGNWAKETNGVLTRELGTEENPESGELVQLKKTVHSLFDGDFTKAVRDYMDSEGVRMMEARLGDYFTPAIDRIVSAMAQGFVRDGLPAAVSEEIEKALPAVRKELFGAADEYIEGLRKGQSDAFAEKVQETIASLDDYLQARAGDIIDNIIKGPARDAVKAMTRNRIAEIKQYGDGVSEDIRNELSCALTVISREANGNKGVLDVYTDIKKREIDRYASEVLAELADDVRGAMEDDVEDIKDGLSGELKATARIIVNDNIIGMKRVSRTERDKLEKKGTEYVEKASKYVEDNLRFAVAKAMGDATEMFDKHTRDELAVVRAELGKTGDDISEGLYAKVDDSVGKAVRNYIIGLPDDPLFIMHVEDYIDRELGENQAELREYVGGELFDSVVNLVMANLWVKMRNEKYGLQE